MRISDWSSDVCSSDLFVGPAFRREMFDVFRQALKPGGILLLHGYREEQLDYATGGPSTVVNLYPEQSLLDAFADWNIAHLVSYDAEIEERSAVHTSELQSLMRISYDVICLKKKQNRT